MKTLPAQHSQIWVRKQGDKDISFASVVTSTEEFLVVKDITDEPLLVPNNQGSNWGYHPLANWGLA